MLVPGTIYYCDYALRGHCGHSQLLSMMALEEKPQQEKWSCLFLFWLVIVRFSKVPFINMFGYK